MTSIDLTEIVVQNRVMGRIRVEQKAIAEVLTEMEGELAGLEQ